MTSRLQRYWMEAAAAAIFLIGAGWLIFPRFVASQRSLTEELVQNELDEIFTALRAYHQDWHGYLPPCLNPPYEALERHFDDSGLFVNGYPPTFQLSSERISELIGTLHTSKILKEPIEAIRRHLDSSSQTILLVQMQFSSSGYPLPIHNCAVAVPWPYTNPQESHKYFCEPGTSRFFKLWDAYEQPKSMTSIIDPGAYFNPSNGLDSFGFVYQDLLGNRSVN